MAQRDADGDNGAVTVAVTVPGRRCSDGPDFDMLSRSLPTAGPILEPEPGEHSMLRPIMSNQSSYTKPVRAGRAATPDEAAPLLETPADDVESPLFFHNTSLGKFWAIFSQVLLIQFIGCFDGTIMASSHPVITSYFGAANSASWLSTAFMLTSTTFQPIVGRLSDAVGRKPIFTGSVFLLGAGTIWCALADSIESFILARALCGLAAGSSMTVGSIITSDLVPIERRGAYQSCMNVIYGVGSALGAALGGAMAETLGWRWEFGVQIPLIVLCLVISSYSIPADLGIADKDEGKTVVQVLREFDLRGSVLLTTAVSFLILGLNLGGNVLPWSHPFVIAATIISSVAFPTFFWAESRTEKPIMPLGLIFSKPRASLIFSNAIAAMLSNAVYFNIPLYFQAVLLTSATTSGLRIVIPTLVSSACGAFTGFAITWTRRLKWPLVCGSTMYFAGTVCLAMLRRDLPSITYTLVLFPGAIGGGFQFPGSMMAVLASSTQAEQAVVTSTLILWRSLGTVLGVALSSLVVQNSLRHYLDELVSGPRKSQVIKDVRASVEAVAGLEQPYRDQVVSSYEAALGLMFACCIGLAAVSVVLVVSAQLKRLPGRK